MKEENGRIVVQWLLPLLCAGIVISIMMFWFFVNIRSDAETEIGHDLTETAENYAGRFKQEIDSIAAAGKMTANVIGSQKISDITMITGLLEAVVQETNAYEAVYCSGSTLCINQSGKDASYMLSETGTGTVLDEAEGVAYTYLKEDGARGDSSIRIILPISDTGERLALYYPTGHLRSVLNVAGEFNYSSFAAVIDTDGSLFFKGNGVSQFLKKDNLWDNIDASYDNAMTRAKVRMQNGSAGYVEAAARGEEGTLVYVPAGIGTWTLILGVNQEYINSQKEEACSETGAMLYQLLLVFVLFVAATFSINMISKARSTEKSRELQEKADMDLLTGLNNKLATERKIKEYLNKNPNQLAMMFVLDIDNFKKINDTMGHAFGDEVLRSIGKRISTNFRVTDIIGRTGGDEFTILLKNLKDETVIIKEAQKLVLFFKDFQVGEYVKYSATASIGATVFPADGSDFEALYKSADHALYKAKKRGKNQLAFFDEKYEKN